MKYHIQTLGCQMNVADSQRLASELERLGYRAAIEPDDAEIHVINTCVVRQQAEDKAWNRLQQLKRMKEKDPSLVIGLMGCLVGVRDPLRLRKQVPFVDVFIPPSEVEPMTAFLKDRSLEADIVTEQVAQRARLEAVMDDMYPGYDTAIILPEHEKNHLVSGFIPIVYGCSHACTFCIIPQKRGKERSRPVGEIAAEVRSLVAQGVKEVVLLGQIVDRYGYDVPDGPDLADLLTVINEVDGLQRIRFLTSHPNYMTDKILYAVRDLPKVMPQIEVPIQAGNNEVLANMKREYSREQYRDLVYKIRDIIPDAAVHCDIIVGFPGETDAQFMETYDILAELKLDKVHLARYSPRPGTVSARRMEDDVTDEEKRRRFHLLEELHKQVSHDINRRYLGETVEVLVEDLHKGRWRGRTPQNKLVFFSDGRDRQGDLVNVQIKHTGPWSMSGTAVDRPRIPTADFAPTHAIPLAMIG